MIFRDISELDNLMSPEQKEKAEKDFRRFYPEETPVVICVSQDSGDGFLRKVDLEDFD